jgi:muramoyltetrapeptide carboxypeptidase LdcA involved in peptidoglycan recycling
MNRIHAFVSRGYVEEDEEESEDEENEENDLEDSDDELVVPQQEKKNKDKTSSKLPVLRDADFCHGHQSLDVLMQQLDPPRLAA